MPQTNTIHMTESLISIFYVGHVCPVVIMVGKLPHGAYMCTLEETGEGSKTRALITLVHDLG